MHLCEVYLLSMSAMRKAVLPRLIRWECINFNKKYKTKGGPIWDAKNPKNLLFNK